MRKGYSISKKLSELKLLKENSMKECATKVVDNNFKKYLGRYVFAVFILMMFSVNSIFAQILTSDQEDYLPGTTATFTASGFQAGEQVTMLVLHYDGTSDEGEDHQPWEVTADVNGEFTTTWHVCEDDCVGSTLRATADGVTSLLHAEVVFTDAGPPTGFIPLSGAGATENFNIATTALPTAWSIQQSNSPTWLGGSNSTNITASGGTPSAGAHYTWGNTGNTNRAIGSMSSGSFASPSSLMAKYQNQTGNAISRLSVFYREKKYRTNTAAASVEFYYSLDGTTWVAVTSGDISAATIGTGANTYNFLNPPGNAKTAVFTFPSIANLGFIYLRWNINTTGSNSQGIGIDDINVQICSPDPVVTAGGPTTFCLGGSVTLTSSATTGNVWNTSETTQSIVVSTSGTYFTTITDGCGVAVSNNILVTVTTPSIPTISASGPTTFCSGGSVVLTSSTSGPYLWSNGETTQSITVSSSGSYSVEVGTIGCIATSVATVVIVNLTPDAPTISADGPLTFCTPDSRTLTSSAASNNLWNTLPSPQSVIVGVSGIYFVSYVDDNGCISPTTSVTVTVNTYGGAVTLLNESMGMPSGNPLINNYSGWSSSSPITFSSTDGATDVRTTSPSPGSGSGNVFMGTATTTNRNFTISGINTIGITGFSLTFLMHRDNLSNGLTVEVSENGTTYSALSIIQPASANTWTNVAATGTIPQTANLHIRFSKNNGTSFRLDDITFTGANNEATILQTNGCGGVVTLNASPGDSYLWSTTETTQSIHVNSTGTYSVTITSNGCTSNASSIVNVLPSVLSASVSSQTDVSCFGGSNGTATISVIGGTAPYTGDGIISGLSAGLQSFTVTDANGCTANTSTTIVQPDAIVATAVITDPLCFGGNGNVEISATGGTGNLTGTGAHSVAAGATYSFTVTDENSCSSNIISGTMAAPTQVVASSSFTPILCNGGTSTVTVTATGGTGSYGITVGAFPVSAGSYSYIVIDDNGCSATTTGTITQPSTIELTETHTDVNCFGGTEGSIDLTVTGGTQVSAPVFTSITETFNSLASSGTSSTVPSGWAFAESGTNANTTYTAGTGSSLTGDTYSFGAASSNERAFGGLFSGSLTPFVGLEITNNTGSTVTAIDISYFGEQWRLGTLGRNDRLDFEYSLDATSLSNGTWNGVNALDFVAPISTGTIGPLDGDANRSSVIGTINGLSIAPNSKVWIGWRDFNATGADDGLAIDDFSYILNAPSTYTYLWSNTATTQDISSLSGDTYSVTVNDANNCAATKSITISVLDLTPPTIIASGTTLDAGCNPTASELDAALGSATANDNCSVGTPTFSDGLITSIGCSRSQTRTFDVFDSNNNAAISVSRTVSWTVDTEIPEITASGTTLDVGINPTAADIEAALGSATATDNCSVGTITYSDGAVSNIGCTYSQTRTFDVSDGCGNAATPVSRIVTWVIDTEAPVITAPADIDVNTDLDVCGATVAIGIATATDNCGVGTPTGTRSDALDLSDLYPVGTTTIAWNVTDDNGNVGVEKIQTVIVTDHQAPTASCKPVTVTLSSGTASIIVADVNNNSSDACGIDTMTLSETTFNCSNIGANNVVLTVTDVNGNSSNCTAIVTVVGTIPSATISQSTLPQFCQGNQVILTAMPSEPVTYAWTGGSTTQSINVFATGTYNLTITNGNGCVATTSTLVNYNPTGFNAAYTLVGFEDVHLHKNTLLNGGVGVTTGGGKARIEQYSVVTAPTTFVKAPILDINTGAVVTNQYIGMANFVAPPYLGNPYSGATNINVASNAMVTLTDSIYKNITIGAGAIVTFTRPIIYIDELKVKQGATVKFTGCTRLSVNKKVDFEKFTKFNLENNKVILYVGDEDKKDSKKVIEWDEGSVFYGNVFAQRGDIKTHHGTVANPIRLYGQFIAREIEGGDYTTWDWNSNCDPACSPTPSPVCACTGGIKRITFEYSTWDVSSIASNATLKIFSDMALTNLIATFSNVNPGDVFTISANSLPGGIFNSITYGQVTGNADSLIVIPTTCNADIVGSFYRELYIHSQVDNNNVLCGNTSCQTGKTLMCHAPINKPAHTHCVKNKDVQKKLNHPDWSVGSCTSVRLSDTQVEIGEMEFTAMPNPFFDVSNIKISLPEDAIVSLAVYNSLGQTVEELYNGKVEADVEYIYQFNGSQHPAGTYFYRLETSDGKFYVKPIILSR